MRTRNALICALVFLLALTGWLLWRLHSIVPAPVGSPQVFLNGSAGHQPTATDATSTEAPTDVYAHNLLLRKGPDFRVYMPWVRGKMLRTDPKRAPSFDDATSFALQIDRGVIQVDLDELAKYLNAVAVPHAEVTNISMSAKDGQIYLRGVAHKLLPLPMELVGSFSAGKDELVHFHVSKISLVKVPLKGLLGGFHLSLASLVRSNQPGVRVDGNDVIFDTKVLLPPPHILGHLTAIELVKGTRGPALEAIYGGAHGDPDKARRWHNFLQLTNGTVDFGKLTMHHVDMIMIDASKDPWFDLDLLNYQAQLVNGITHMTPQAGLQIFMPNVSALPPHKPGEDITTEWLRDRNLPPPSGIPFK